jgi:hypothetical protein
MSVPVFSVDSAAGDLKIDWTAPDMQGNAITQYEILIANAQQTQWLEYSPTCSGSDVLTTFCLISMAVLQAAPYSYS